MKVKLHCYKHPWRRAVAVVNGKFPMCQDCADGATVAILNAGAMLCIAIQGEPQALLIPQEHPKVAHHTTFCGYNVN